MSEGFKFNWSPNQEKVMKDLEDKNIEEIIKSIEGMQAAKLQRNLLPDIYTTIDSKSSVQQIPLWRKPWAIAASIFLLMLNVTAIYYHLQKQTKNEQSFIYDPMNHLLTEYTYQIY